MKTKLNTLQNTAERCQKALENLVAINEELRTLPPSERVSDILDMNEHTTQTTRRLLESMRPVVDRLHGSSGSR